MLFLAIFVVSKGLASAFSLPITSEIPALTEAITVDPAGCLGGVKQFSGCKALYSAYNDCNAKTNEAEQVSCLCTQGVFNYIFE